MTSKLRKGLKVLYWMVGAFLVLWMLIWSYVFLNKKKLVSQVVTELNKSIRGEIKIADLEPSLLSTFPNVSLRLSKVIVRDTMWNQHRHDLVNAERIYIRLQLFSLFSGNPEISKVIVQDASMYLFSDSTGYTNAYLFDVKNADTASTKSVGSAKVPDLELDRVRIIIDQKKLAKFYDFDVRSLDCNTRNLDSSLQFNVKISTLVHHMGFNTENGSFLKEKTLNGRFRLGYSRPKKTMAFKNVVLEVDNHPFSFNGSFNFSSKPLLYYLDISSKGIDYKRTSALLSENISSKLDSFQIEKPFDVRCIIDGRTLPNRIPHVSLEAVIRDNNITTRFAQFTDASFTARFNNQLSPQGRRVDNNSGFSFTGFTGKVENIECRADTVTINDLDHPVLNCDVHTDSDITDLNEVLGTSSIEFKKGRVRADIRYRGSILEGDTAAANINGNINLSDASIMYSPRNLAFNNCSGSIIFDNQDVYVKQLKAQTGSTSLLMNGAAKNLTSLIDQSPEKTLLSWTIFSPRLNLVDFTAFLNKRSTAASRKQSKRRFIKLANKIDRMLNDCSVALQLNADRVAYKKFDASKLAANLQLTDRVVSIKNLRVQHADGTIAMEGKMVEESPANRIAMHSVMDNVDITQVFAAFNNFGQDGIMDKNLKGRLSSTIDINGLINGKAEVVENSLNGTVNISLKDGALIDFEPLKNISQVAFKNRDFSNVRFAELKEKLEVNGSQFKVSRMEIQSTVMTMFVEGVYDVKKGTDLSIQVPLSNLAKRGESFKLKNKGVDSKTGVSVWLRAKTGDNGKAKISWDPFKLALKQGADKILNGDTTEVPAPEPVKRRRGRKNAE